jgi:hypothetical protein
MTANGLKRFRYLINWYFLLNLRNNRSAQRIIFFTYIYIYLMNIFTLLSYTDYISSPYRIELYTRTVASRFVACAFRTIHFVPWPFRTIWDVLLLKFLNTWTIICLKMFFFHSHLNGCFVLFCFFKMFCLLSHWSASGLGLTVLRLFVIVAKKLGQWCVRILKDFFFISD